MGILELLSLNAKWKSVFLNFFFLINRFNYIFLWIYSLNVQIFLKLMSYQISDIKGKMKWDTKYIIYVIYYGGQYYIYNTI